MKSFNKIINEILKANLNEMMYPGNLGAIEMIQFFQKANSSQIKQMEKIVKNEDWDGFKILIKQVLGVKLK